MPRKKVDEATRKLVANRLNEAIANKGITAKELSKRTGISESDISNYRHARYIPNQYNVFLLSLALSCNPSWLWGLVDSAGEKESLRDYYWESMPDKLKDQTLDYMSFLLLMRVKEDDEEKG